MNRNRFFFAPLLAFLLSSCATITSGLDAGLIPDGTASIVVGRSQFLHNGTAATPGSISALIPPAIMSHISPFTSIEAVNTNPFAPGQWAIKARINENGYFAVSLPPGRYYFVEFVYPSLLQGFIAIRSYMSILGSTINQRVLMTFDVLPGKATYIGTMQHLVTDVTDSHEADWNWSLKVVDESQAAQDWLGRTYPRWDGTMVVKVAEIQTLD